MGFFDDDSFESMIERMFGGNGSFVEYSDRDGKRVYKRGNDISNNLVEGKRFIYFILDLSNKKDVEVRIKDNRRTNGFSERFSESNTVLEIKSSDGEIFEYVLPKKIAKRKFEYNFNNGILEVAFQK